MGDFKVHYLSPRDCRDCGVAFSRIYAATVASRLMGAWNESVYMTCDDMTGIHARMGMTQTAGNDSLTSSYSQVSYPVCHPRCTACDLDSYISCFYTSQGIRCFTVGSGSPLPVQPFMGLTSRLRDLFLA